MIYKDSINLIAGAMIHSTVRLELYVTVEWSDQLWRHGAKTKSNQTIGVSMTLQYRDLLIRFNTLQYIHIATIVSNIS
jgi:hypothetical protein